MYILVAMVDLPGMSNTPTLHAIGAVCCIQVYMWELYLWGLYLGVRMVSQVLGGAWGACIVDITGGQISNRDLDLLDSVYRL